MSNKAEQGEWSNYISKLEALPALTYEWEVEFFDLMLGYVRDNNRVVELGCSNARWVKLLMNNKKNVEGHGVDMNSEGFIYGDIKYYASDVRKTQLESDRFDIVFSIGLIEHFKDSDLEQILNEHVRIAGKEGLIIISVPTLNYFSLNFAKIKMMELLKIYKGPKHFHITAKQIASILTARNCKIMDVKYLGWIFRWKTYYIPKLIDNFFFSDSLVVIAKKIGPTA